MPQFQEWCIPIVEHVEVSPGYKIMTIAAVDFTNISHPGQFVLIKCGTSYDPFLRRPLSIHRVDRNKGEASFLYQIKGTGTKWLSVQHEGDVLQILGPLGQGFRYSGSNKKGLLIGAGVGVAPLLFLAQELAFLKWKLTVLIGARNVQGLLAVPELNQYGIVKTITEDGSSGTRGTIVDLINEEVKIAKWDMIFACGPSGVLKEVKKISTQRGIPAQISLEERMACGVGACLGCVCKLAETGDYVRICKEGPVFNAREVAFCD